jgi:hypothetical protein
MKNLAGSSSSLCSTDTEGRISSRIIISIISNTFLKALKLKLSKGGTSSRIFWAKSSLDKAILISCWSKTSESRILAFTSSSLIFD